MRNKGRNEETNERKVSVHEQDQEKICALAFQLYWESRCRHGQDQEHWLEDERRVLAEIGMNSDRRILRPFNHEGAHSGVPRLVKREGKHRFVVGMPELVKINRVAKCRPFLYP